MKHTNLDDCLPVISKLEDQIQTTGITLEIGSDFRHFKNQTMNLHHKTQIGPKYDPDNKGFNSNGAFWIMGRNSVGEVVHTQAVCIEDLHDLPLATYLQDHFTDFIPFLTDPKTTRFLAGPGTEAIRGLTCYHGEFWLKGGPDGYRGAGLAAPLMRLGVLHAMHLWSPDYIFAFIRSDIICKGLATRAGFMHTEPDSIAWSRMGDDKVHKTWTAWITRAEILHLMRLTAMDLELPLVESVVNLGLRQVA